MGKATDPEKLSQQIMVRLDAENGDTLLEMAEAMGNTPGAIARLAVKALIKAYLENGRRLSFPLELNFAAAPANALNEPRAEYGKKPRSAPRPPRPGAEEKAG